MNPSPTSSLCSSEAIIAFRADDAGAATGITDGICAVVRTGLVRNVSVMVPPPGFAHAVERLRDLEAVEFGLHATLNCEWHGKQWRPVAAPSQIPALVDADGFFLKTPADLHARHVPLEQLLIECRAQLARLRSSGFPVSYLDEHMGVGWLPGLRDALRDLAREEGLFHADDVPVCAELQNALADPSVLAAVLPTLNGTFKAICHPARNDSSTQSLRLVAGERAGAVAEARAREMAALTDPAVLALFSPAGTIRSTFLSRLISPTPPKPIIQTS